MMQPAPLTREEIARLQRWQRRMVRHYAWAMAVMAAAITLVMAYGEQPWVRRSALGVAVLLLLVSAWVQFRERCPRCSARIGRQARLFLPRRCKVCGVAFDA